MEINFNLYYQKHIGTIAKDNETILNGIEATCDIDLSNVNYMYANYCIGGTYKKDTNVNIDLAKNTIQIPIKTDYLKKGNNQFEIVAIMKNGDIKTSQTYDYYISKSLENEEALEGDNNYPILIQLIESIKVVEQNEEIRKQNEIQRESTFNQKIYLLDNNEVDRNVRFENKLNEVDRNVSSKILEFDKNEINRNKRIDSKLIEINDTVLGKVSELDSNENIRKSNEVARQSNEVSRNNEFNNIKTQFSDLKNNVEVIGARKDTKGVTHNSLDTRIDKEVEYINNRLNVVNVDVEGSYITVTDSVEGSINNTEVLGNTVQNATNLADIKSVGIKKEDGTYEMSILSCGKNLFDGVLESGVFGMSTGEYLQNASSICNKNRFIKVYPNMKLSVGTVGDDKALFYYDKNKKFISSSGGTTTTLFTTPSNCYYINFRIISTDTNKKIQIEEGTVATPYEPYQSNKCDISLPCQLEKVGDVADRLYYDDVEKAWCIEKKIFDFIVPSNLTWINYAIAIPSGSVGCYATSSLIGTLNQNLITKHDYAINDTYRVFSGNVVGSATLGNMNGIFIRPDNNAIYIKGVANSYSDLGKELEGKILKTISSNPQKIVLPLDMQIQLNSFFGTTNMWLESGEVEGTIKATVPKSLGASVQSLSDKTDILSNRVEAIEGLKDSQNMTYQTDKGYLVAEKTQNGVVKDLKLEGKTLVNLCPSYSTFTKGGSGNPTISVNEKSVTLSGDSNSSLACSVYPTQQLYDITIIFNVTHTLSSFDLGYYDTTYRVVKANLSSGLNVVHLKSDKPLARVWLGSTVYSPSPTFTISNLIILEGDHTQNPPSYFEGIKSVGQDVSEIEVLSSNEDFRFSYEEGAISTGNGSNVPNDTAFRTSFIKCHSNINYELNYNCFIFLYDSSKKFIKSVNGADPLLANTPFNSENASYIRFYKGKTDFEKVQITSKTYQSHKKSILYYNELGELVPVPQLREWDSVEEKNGKTLYTVGTDNNIFDGTQDWAYNEAIMKTSTDTIGFQRQINSIDNSIICDKFNRIDENTMYSGNVEGVCIYLNSSLRLRIRKDKIGVSDSDSSEIKVQKLKTYLSSNNITILNKLKEPKIYECPNLNLSSYSNETMISLNSGAINPHMEFSITSHINELVKNNQSRINELEQRMMNMFKSVLSGDMQSLAYSLYPQDFESDNENEIELLPVEPV